MWTALVREVSPTLAKCELSYLAREPIDLERAVAQHADYQQALQSLGCRVFELPPEPTLPDAVFVEDTAIVLDEIAVLTRPGAPSRRDEVPSVAAALRTYRALLAIEAPATLDGGDVLRIARTLYVGQSARSNPDGILQLRQLLREYGYEVIGVRTRDCLHLKSAVTQVADDCVLLQPGWVERTQFAHLRMIDVDPTEAHAANIVRVGDALLMPANFPRTRQRLIDAGFAVSTVDVSELQKAEGAVTCCSLLIRSDN
ncbi:MAG: arginine deiminase family protein [Rhodanobacteraceae bacterium]